MDQIWLYVLTILLLLLPLFFFSFFLTTSYKNKQKSAIINHKILPPSPLSLPIIGHLYLVKKGIIHRTLHQLSLKYGSIYSLKFGCLPFVIISSPAAVEECFTKNDMVLANRPRVLAGKHLHYDFTTIGAAPYGPLWQSLRRLTSLELFSTNRMNSFACIRVEEVRSLVKGLFGSSKGNFYKFEMGLKFSGLTLNILTRVLTGKRYFSSGDEKRDGDDEEGKEFIGLMREVFELNGLSNAGDSFPILRRILFKKIERRMVEARDKMDEFLNGLIKECRKGKNGSETENNDEGKTRALIFKLLDLQDLDPANYSDQIIKGIIMIMLIAGTDTTAVTMEWALSLLLNHPNALKKAREEIDKHKSNGELVEEDDLPKLPYIQCIIKETLRLFPAAPLLVGHEASADITISGYHIAKGNICLINAWAIHRDPNLWEDPLKFKPERFEGLKNEEIRFSLIPFGLGRRSCPGDMLANRVLCLTLATLIQCFDWERVDEQDVDLTEGIGLTMPKAIPLEAMCRPRQCMINVLSKM